MAQMSVEEFASKLGLLPNVLLEQLQAAGVNKQLVDDGLTEDDKTQLLDYLRAAHGTSGAKDKLSLSRRQSFEIKKSDNTGRARTIQVQVRKKRVLSKPAVSETKEEVIDDPVENVVVEAPVTGTVIDAAELALREQQAKKQSALFERQAADADEKRRIKEAEEVKKVEEKEIAQPKTATPPIAKKEASEKSADSPSVLTQDKDSEHKLTEGTLHKPVAKTVDDGEKKKKPVKQVIWKDNNVKKRGTKTRQHSSDNQGWRTRRDRHGKSSSKSDDQNEHAFTAPTEPIVHEIMVPETISVSMLAQKMSIKAAEIIKVLMKMGNMVTINQMLDQDTAMIIVEEMGHTAKYAAPDSPEAFLETTEAPADDVEMIPRAPVVTVMGHVDHGKTSLLDYIRRTGVASGEAGGITQHIGAYHVETGHGMITFLDTPGHEAFTAMRARGSKITDLVILVVAADDGVMPQTIEAVNHAKAANIPIIVAVNKIDKPEANPERIKQELVAHEVVPEDWGGDTMFVDVSAKEGTGIDQILEAILLQAEILELKVPKNALMKGVVIESRLDKGRGPVATVLVQSGTLKRGDVLLAGAVFGKVRAMFDENGKTVKQAGASFPVEIQGLSEVPVAGAETKGAGDRQR